MEVIIDAVRAAVSIQYTILSEWNFFLDCILFNRQGERLSGRFLSAVSMPVSY